MRVQTHAESNELSTGLEMSSLDDVTISLLQIIKESFYKLGNISRE